MPRARGRWWAGSVIPVVSGNNVLHSASWGIMVVGEGTTGTVLRENNVIANAMAEQTGFSIQCRSGIRVRNGGTSLTNNISRNNVACGFFVETKESQTQFGNRAENNGEPGQCDGLTCRP